MNDVNAPTGWTANRCFIDRCGWKVYAKKIGATWFEDLGYIGHAGEPEDVLNDKAEARVAEYAERGF